MEAPKKPQKPFKLCFMVKNLPGKSDIHIGRPLKLSSTLTEKFYVNDSEQAEKLHEIVDKYIDKLRVESPRKKQSFPLTENQRYGWYNDEGLINFDGSDKRLNFHKQPDVLIKEHLMNYAKIRE